MSRAAVSSLKGQFLIAMPGLADPNFRHAVAYICEHTAEGALGIVINRPLDMRLREVLEHMGIEARDRAVEELPVYLGGPVQTERGFVLHHPPGDWGSVLRVDEELALASSRDILEAMARGEGPRQALVALGYAGWGAGQLEQELAANAWLSAPAERRIIFETPWEQRWQAAAGLLGIDLAHVSNEIGHA